MTDLLRIVVVFLLLVLLLRKGIPIGIALLVGSGILAVFYLMPPSRILLSIKKAFSAPITYELLIALTAIRAFEMILRQQKGLEKMMQSMKVFLKNKKAVIVSMPLLIGMIPSVGGAYFSAPMVDEATKDIPMSPEEKAFANYWYRHPWEYILPLYPGIVLASGITGIPLRTYIFLNLSYSITMFLSGFFFLSKAKGRFDGIRDDKGSLKSFIPIFVLLLSVAVLGVPLHWALLGIVFSMLIYWRYDLRKTFQVIRHSLSMDVIILIIGVILFKEVLEVSGAVENLSRFFSKSGIPILSVLFILPFITGMLTGVTIGFVGAVFPLLVSLTGPSLNAMTFAFASGFVGVLLSPVHVCLILTKEYFHADISGIYKRTIPLGGLILLVALIEFFLLRGFLGGG